MNAPPERHITATLPQGVGVEPPLWEPPLDLSPVPDVPAREVFLAWEKLRLAYNAALTGLVCLFGWPDFIDRAFWLFLVGGAFFANLCFCVGPCAEGYLAWMGIGRRAARWFLFLSGTFLACLLALLALLAWQLRNFH
jgi:hypothetical protein